MSLEVLIQKTIPVGPLRCNCQILVCPKTLETVVVDPGDEADRILSQIHEIEKSTGQKLKVKALLHTHAHFDHMGATRKVKESFEKQGIAAPTIYLHEGDDFIYRMFMKQVQMFGFSGEEPRPVDTFIQDEEILTFGSLKLTVIHTPGHSPGGVCYHLHSDDGLQIPEMVFTGDTLFRESVGRTDLWQGDSALLKRSIQNRLFTLDDDTTAWPGHGFKTSIGYEKKSNPYV